MNLGKNVQANDAFAKNVSGIYSFPRNSNEFILAGALEEERKCGQIVNHTVWTKRTLRGKICAL